MPLARIITDVADDSLELTMQLRARGFQVETVAPDQISNTAADLEVRLEECAPEDMLMQAAQVSEADDLWVFVAPGALDESVRPFRTIPLVPRGPEAKTEPVTLPKREGEARAMLPILSIDGFDEDLILSEVGEFRMPVPAAERLPEPKATGIAEVASKVASQSVSEPCLPRASDVSRPIPERSDWVAREGKTPSPTPAGAPPLNQPEVPMIAIAPQSAANFVVAPTPAAVRTHKPFGRLNLRSWTVAFATLALVMTAWFLVTTLRPDVAPVSGQSPTTVLHATPNTALSQRVGVSPGARQLAPVTSPAHGLRAELPKAPHPRTSQVLHPARRAAKHSHGDGLIAEDTVVFYDRKPSPPRAKAQPQPGVKQYSDQN